MIEWKEEYSIGISAIDKQHQHMFHLAAQLQPENQSDAAAVLSDLRAYAAEHFRSEEAYMKIIDYDRLLSQIADHNEFVEMLQVFEGTQAGETLDLKRILTFLTDWIDIHNELRTLVYALVQSRPRN